MSARDKALEVMFWGSPGADDEESRAYARGLLDAVVHELAEQIRAFPDTQWWGQGENRAVYEGDTSMCYVVADLIDPEVQS